MGALVDPISKSWNVDLLNSLFLPFEVDHILEIPISHRLSEDLLCWDLEKNGVYSVRSAYRALIGDVWRGMEEAPSDVTDFWKVIWSAAFLPRVKLFVGKLALMRCLLKWVFINVSLLFVLYVECVTMWKNQSSMLLLYANQ